MTGVKVPAWETKAHATIARLCFAAWDKAQQKRGGGRYRRHRPYAIPAEADALVKALGMHDRREAEETCKALFFRVFDLEDMGVDVGGGAR